MRKAAIAVVLGAGMVLAGCSDDAQRDVQVVNERGAVVTNFVGNEPGEEYYVVRRLCDGTTGVYSMKDTSGYDFQVVPYDPACTEAK